MFLTFGFLCLALIAILPLVALRQEPAKVRSVEILFFLLLACGLISFRLPFLVTNVELNPDESQMLAQAMKFRTDWLPWRSVDGTTTGPLNSYVGMWPFIFGLPVDFGTGRATGVMLALGALLALYLAGRKFLSAPISMALTLAPATFLYFAVEWDFIHISSEHLPMFLTALGIYGLASFLEKPRVGPAFCLGLLAGALPFTKLQAAPLGVAFGALLLAAGFLRGKRAERLAWIGFFVAGALLVTSAILLPVALAGYWQDFVNRYLRMPFVYVAINPWPVWVTALKLMKPVPSFHGFLCSMLLFLTILLGATWRRGVLNRTNLFLISGAAFLLATSVFIVLKPNYNYSHYLLLLLVPFTTAAGVLVFVLSTDTAIRPRLDRFAPALAGLLLVPQLLFYFTQKLPHSKFAIWLSPTVKIDDRTAGFLAKHQVDGDRLTVWGWGSKYYVLSGIPPAGRDIHTQWAIANSPLRDYYFRSYMKDLRSTKPRFFLDAVTESRDCWPDPKLARADVYPEISQYIAENYVFLGESPVQYNIIQKHTEPLRLYIRKDALGDLAEKSPDPAAKEAVPLDNPPAHP